MTISDERRKRIQQLTDWASDYVKNGGLKVNRESFWISAVFDDDSPSKNIEQNHYYRIMVIDDLIDTFATEAQKRWMLSISSAKDYAKMVYNTLAKQVEQEIMKNAPATRRTIDSLYGRPQADSSKMKTFFDVFKSLAGFDNNEVDERVLIVEVIKTGKFQDENDVRATFKKAVREGLIYERRPGYWSKS